MWNAKQIKQEISSLRRACLNQQIQAMKKGEIDKQQVIQTIKSFQNLKLKNQFINRPKINSPLILVKKSSSSQPQQNMPSISEDSECSSNSQNKIESPNNLEEINSSKQNKKHEFHNSKYRKLQESKSYEEITILQQTQLNLHQILQNRLSAQFIKQQIEIKEDNLQCQMVHDKQNIDQSHAEVLNQAYPLVSNQTDINKQAKSKLQEDTKQKNYFKSENLNSSPTSSQKSPTQQNPQVRKRKASNILQEPEQYIQLRKSQKQQKEQKTHQNLINGMLALFISMVVLMLIYKVVTRARTVSQQQKNSYNQKNKLKRNFIIKPYLLFCFLVIQTIFQLYPNLICSSLLVTRLFKNSSDLLKISIVIIFM